jgi:hypothetical protein
MGLDFFGSLSLCAAALVLLGFTKRRLDVLTGPWIQLVIQPGVARKTQFNRVLAAMDK